MAFKTRLRQSKIIKLIEYSCYKMKETSNNSKHEIIIRVIIIIVILELFLGSLVFRIS